MQLHRVTCSYISLHGVTWAWMQVHELAWSFMSLYAVTSLSEQLTRISQCLFCLSSSQELRSACLFIPIYFRSSLRKIYSFLGYKEDQGRMDCVYHYSTGKFSFKCQISAAVQYINKTKYFRLRLYYKLSKRAYRDLRQFWDRNMRESWRFSALSKLVPDGRTDIVTP